MKIKNTSLTFGILIGLSMHVFAGNPDRAGSAGASELLINPWARSSGWAGANVSFVRGLEAQYLNVAGTAFTKNTELIFARTDYLSGTGISVNAFGLTQKLGEAGVMGVGIMSMGFGDIERTTVDVPEGGIGTFSPKLMNMTFSFAKEFSRSIYGGMAVKVISESTSDVNARGVAFDAGIQYVTGFSKKNRDNLKFGISLKNVGPSMKFSGDGLAFKDVLSANNVDMTIEQRSAKYELPSSLNIGLSYDFKFGGSDSLEIPPMHRITSALAYTSNSFSLDQYTVGLEYAYKTFFMIRGGYMVEEGSIKSTFLTGPTAGITFEIPLSKEKDTTFGIDYSYRDTNPFSGIHSIGARINI